MNSRIPYVCGTCGASGVKLWRESGFLPVPLSCGACALKAEDRAGPISADGRIPGRRHGTTDQIGSLLPAVPANEGETFWGYTSIPQDMVDWWRGLPSAVVTP